ncbi:hypothetical protein [Aphanizomenon sp. UHCC 0183]|uniref:hypothetical protein n=1 Tax=Aphanizomenon sp. UHCC 0183 TaxID=2590028 RepID=UPI0020C460E2|nr:hypothetical protein [Aphanizomenon sp. UHCC 0183]
MSVENCRYGKAKGKRQEARVKRVWAILHFFTQFGFIVFTYLDYIHHNPVQRGYVDKPSHWRYSSYRNYLELPSLLSVELVDF